MFRESRIAGIAALTCFLGLSGVASGQCQLTRLVASDGEQGDWLGRQVALSGDWGFVATSRTDDQGAYSGSVYVTHKGASGWTLVNKLLASDGTAGRSFGSDVSMDGDHAVVGSAFGAYFFERGPAGWVEVQRLLGSDTVAGASFGRTVCIRGDRAIVKGVGTNSQGVPDVSMAYIFERGAGGWSEVAKLESPDGVAGDQFGDGLALGDDRAIIGAPRHDLHGFHNKGAAYVFERTPSGWVYEAKLSVYLGNDSDGFGTAVAASGDRVALTAPGEDSVPSGIGAVYVFHRTPTGWEQEARLIPNAPIAYGYAYHGLDMSDEKVFVTGYLVGESGEQGGRISIYKRTAAGWRFEHLLGADVPQIGGLFGTGVAVSGDTILVGARGSGDVCDTSCDSGAAFVFAAPLESAHNFCESTANTSGDEAVISIAGCTSIAMNDMLLLAGPIPSGRPGIFYYGDRSLLAAPFGDGLRCVGGQVFRLPLTQAQDDVLSTPFDLGPGSPSAGHVTAGSTWYFQAYYRDPSGGPAGFNLSDAIEVVFQN